MHSGFFSRTIHDKTVFLYKKVLYLKSLKKRLRTLFGAYEQFVGHLWNVFSGYNDRNSFWNGTLTQRG